MNMPSSSFYKTLVFVTTATGVALAVLHSFAPPAQPHWKFSIATLGLFALVCIGLYYAGRSSAQSQNKYAFTNLVSVSVFGKMVLAMAALFMYQQIAQPQNQWFVGIFLGCYVVYTAFEVWFMTKLARG